MLLNFKFALSSTAPEPPVITTRPSVKSDTINDATDCQCLDPNENDCDLLPDIQLSWFGILEPASMRVPSSTAT